MKTIDVSLTVAVPLKNIGYLLCTAFESGVYYWCNIDTESSVRPDVIDFEAFKDDNIFDKHEYSYVHWPLSGGNITILDTENNSKHTLDMSAIQSGLKIMAEKFPKDFNDFMEQNYDAITSDVFIQCCIFGDVIYG